MLAAVVIDVIGFGIVMPVLPELVTQLGHMELDAATRVAGWMLAVFAIAQFFAGPVLGHLGDRFGRRPVLIAAMLGLVTAVLDPLIVSQSLAWGAARDFDGAAFVVAAVLLLAAMAIITRLVPHRSLASELSEGSS